MRMRAAAAHKSTFRHEALLYRNEDEFLAGTVPFVRDAVAAGEPVLVALSADKAERIEAELNGEAEGVQFADMPSLGRNPACIIPAWRDFVADHLAEGRPMRGIGEPIWPERSAAEVVECQRHEWLLNLAFADAPSWWLLCPYDAQRLAPEVLAAAHMTHPHIADHGCTYGSDAYRDPRVTGDPFALPLPPPAEEPERLVFTLDELPLIRLLVSRLAAEAGLDDARTGDLLIAVNEVATNSVRHAGGRGAISLWREGDLLLCEVRDGGVLEDPLAGRERPPSSWTEGRGLWIANQLCDLAQIRSFAEGNVVRLHMSV
jgi:anti-sigma regulatory factor (Ser/Thr protein kinase)